MTETESIEAANREYATAMAAILSTYEGRLVLWEMLTRCEVYSASFAGEATHMTAFREGRRDIGLRLRVDIENLSPEIDGRMRTEHLARLARYHVEPGNKETEQ